MCLINSLNEGGYREMVRRMEQEKGETMKRTYGIHFGMAMGMIMAALLLGGVAAQAALVDAALNDWKRLRDDWPQDGVVDHIATTLFFTGDDVGDRFFRTVAVFELPTLGAGEYIDNATFRWKVENVIDNSTSALPHLDVAFLDKGSVGTVASADYNASHDALINRFATPATTNGSTKTWSNATLLSAISNAYDNSSSYVAFRLQLAATGDYYDWVNGWPTSDGDDAANGAPGFNGTSDGYRNTASLEDGIGLELSVIPEPASISMLLFAVGVAGFLRRRLRARG
jgi:hypothetical protein